VLALVHFLLALLGLLNLEEAGRQDVAPEIRSNALDSHSG
jgi:hypothetical protein